MRLPLITGHAHPCLRHERQQAEGLQSDRLPASIRPRDHDPGVLTADLDLRRDHVAFQERVPPSHQDGRPGWLKPG